MDILDAADTPNPGTLTATAGSAELHPLHRARHAAHLHQRLPAGIHPGHGHPDVTVTATRRDLLSRPPHDSVTFFITAPSVTVGLSPATASVALGGTQQFIGYAVGNVNNALTWQVNGVTGGSTSTRDHQQSAGTLHRPRQPCP